MAIWFKAAPYTIIFLLQHKQMLYLNISQVSYPSWIDCLICSYELLSLQVLAIQFVNFAIEFVPLAIEFVTLAIEFIPLAAKVIKNCIRNTLATKFVTWAQKFLSLQETVHTSLDKFSP